MAVVEGTINQIFDENCLNFRSYQLYSLHTIKYISSSFLFFSWPKRIRYVIIFLFIVDLLKMWTFGKFCVHTCTPLGRSEGILPQKIFKIEVFGNRSSGFTCDKANSASYNQVRALEAPECHRWLTFAFGRLEKLFFHVSLSVGTQDFIRPEPSVMSHLFF